MLHHSPSVAQLHAAVQQKTVPHGGAHGGNQRKGDDRHFAHAGGDGNEMAYHRNKAGDEHGHQALLAAEIALCPFQIPWVEQEILAHLQHQGRTAVVAQPVGKERAAQGTQTGGKNGQTQVPAAIGHQKADKGHDRFAGNRRDHALQHHQKKGAEIGGFLEDVYGDCADVFRNHGEKTGKRK